MDTNKESLLSVDFQDGFVNDSIIIRINENEVFRKNNVSTDLRIAMADNSFNTTVSNGQIKIDILVPSKNLKFSQNIEINSDAYLGVSIINSDTTNPEIKVKVEKQPFTYL